MREILLSSAVAMAMSCASFSIQAAESATLSLTGAILPATCDVTLSSTSVDFGNIAASTLIASPNYVATPPVDLSIACDAAAAIGVQTTDNRSSSAMTVAEINSEMGTNFSDFIDTQVFGLGLDRDSKKIGALSMVVTSATLNGSATNNLLSSIDKATWEAHTFSATSPYMLNKNGYVALAKDAGASSPDALTTATYTLGGGVMLKKGNKYPTGEKINIDGNITFSIVYL
ncbi:MAG: DUF1120 domain-containing protein [Pantoea sp.]|uniref:DUF1120 domain-containing protein n=1 Tax=Pantoea septica TaxID=472695 RepID=UPI000E93C39F|nr:DUF1120 domain-containing protein [Pantoea septica]MDU5836452.1 DUF1120 domain-containing protein [Pantoea sp.]MDU6441241.1 DUF1120 domain-containing protein [Pantoea sp.]HAT24746.1 hypothetical protein [Pantoea septica]